MIEIVKTMIPMIKALFAAPILVFNELNNNVIGIVADLIRLHTSVVAVDLRLVPNCSAVEVIITDHEPREKPKGIARSP